MTNIDDFTLSITSSARPRELEKTLEAIKDFPNIQVIINGTLGNKDTISYDPIIQKFNHQVNFIINQKNQGIAANWNKGVILTNTRYVILSSDDLEFPKNWFQPLLDVMRKDNPPLQASLSNPMSFSCFCIDKKLIYLQGWFDQNFSMAYYEDEDWYLRFRERLGLFNNPIEYDRIIPRLNSVIRHPHKGGKWGVAPNYIYYHWKWKKEQKPTQKTLHSRENILFQRRLTEPVWPALQSIREAYGKNDFSKKEWKYSKPRWEIRLITLLTKNRIFTSLRNLR